MTITGLSLDSDSWLIVDLAFDSFVDIAYFADSAFSYQNSATFSYFFSVI